jgi:DNA (cytosine-5)-methyltransferase 1
MNTKKYTYSSYFCGAAGLDLGFEKEKFTHIYSSDIDLACTKTIKHNRKKWNVECADIREIDATDYHSDVVLAGFPCQGFSLGGNRNIEDPRNQLFKQAIRIVQESKPKIVVFENVLNLRTMTFNEEESAAETIANALTSIGYEVHYDFFKVSYFGVPQTRRRFIFIAFRDGAPKNYFLPQQDEKETSIKNYLEDLALDSLKTYPKKLELPNNEYNWGFKSNVHTSRFDDIKGQKIKKIFPVRLSRTASDGNPIRDFDKPFQAIDTGTIWGWGAGEITAERHIIDRENSKNVRNKNSKQPLWRIEADCLRRFSNRELARLQTFPDDWEFIGIAANDIQKQIGNAVPVEFSRRIAENVKKALIAIDEGEDFSLINIVKKPKQLKLL